MMRKTARKAAKAVQKNATRAATGMLGLSGERMTKVDTAWLRMDSESNLMMIVGVWTLKPGHQVRGPVPAGAGAPAQVPRFGQRVVEDAAGATWVEDRNFRHRQPRGAREAARQAKGQRAGGPAGPHGRTGHDPAGPQAARCGSLHLVEDYQGGSALMVRIHHCIADGIALISVTMSLVDGGAAAARAQAQGGAAGAEDWITDTLIKPLHRHHRQGPGQRPVTARPASLGMLRDPQKGMAGSPDMARWPTRCCATRRRWPDARRLPTRLKGKPGPHQARGLVRPSRWTKSRPWARR
jgi:diacylglycerol O-acyltransferase